MGIPTLTPTEARQRFDHLTPEEREQIRFFAEGQGVEVTDETLPDLLIVWTLMGTIDPPTA